MKRDPIISPPCNAGTAIVIGGTVGFGSGITHELSRRGHAVLTVGRSTTPPPGALGHYPCDVSDTRAWQTTARQIVDATVPDSVQVLVYTVGYARVFPFGETPPDEWDRHFRLNLTYVAESFPHFEQILSSNARVATTGSQWSFRHGWPDLIPYITAKHALACLTDEYAATYPQRHFKHYCVPTMATPGYRAVRASASANKGRLHGFSNPRKPANPMHISRTFVDHLLGSTQFLPVMFEINCSGDVNPVVRL